MKIADVVPYSLAVRALFDANYTALFGYDDQFENPYKADVWQPKIDAANGVVVTLGKREQNQADTKTRNKYMDNLSPILKDLEYRIGLCITAGTITDSLSSFGLGAFNRSIDKKSINAFHTAYETTITAVNANQTALTAKGFTATKTGTINTNHQKAWDMQDTKIELKEAIADLSDDNQVILNAVLDEDQKVVNGLRAMAEATGDTELKKKATLKAILKTVVPTAAKKPRNRKIKMASSIVLNKDLVAKNLVQLTLKTNVRVTLCRTVLKTDQCTTGIDLPYNVMWEGKKADIPGTGEFVKLTNKSTSKDAVVLAFEIDVKK